MEKTNKKNFKNEAELAIIKFPKITEFDLKEIDDMSSCVAHSVRAHKQNSRQGTVSCKGRSELISRSNKKPWKQKGTGRARAGTPRSPLWRGGAVSHGPQKRVRKLKVSKKAKNNANLFLFLNLLRKEKILSLNWMPNRSCSSAYEILKQNKIHNKKIILMYDCDDFETFYSFSNLKNVHLVSYDSLYTYIFAHDCMFIYLEKDSLKFKSLVESWQN